MKNIVAFLLSVVTFNVMSMEFHAGEVRLSSCSKTEWIKTGLFDTPSPMIKQTEQRATVTVVIEGSNINKPEFQSVIQKCIPDTTKNIGLESMASQPAESSDSYKETFLTCLKPNAPTLNISILFIKVDTQCLWPSKNWGIVFGADNTISSALDEIRREKGSELYLRLGFFRSVKRYGDYQSANNDLPRMRNISFGKDAFLVNLDKWCSSPEPATDTNTNVKYFKCR